MRQMKRLAILGATGSIGANTLDVVARHPRSLPRRRADRRTAPPTRCSQLCRAAPAAPRGARPDAAERPRAARCASRELDTELLFGARRAGARSRRIPTCDTVMAAIVGAAGLPSTLAAARAGKRVLLANKEALVMAGALFMRAARDAGGATLLPIDSEHNAVFQCLPRTHARDRQGRRAPHPAHRFGRAVPRHAARDARRASRPSRRARIRTG